MIMGVPPDRKEYNLGYRFYPKLYPHSAGYPRLDITIVKIPSERHFDPDEVQLLVFSSADGHRLQRIEHLKVFHPWPYQSSYQVAPGMIMISDRKDKKVEAFSFGGILQINVGDENTRCVIESDAPIIEINLVNRTVMELVEEVEIILAKRRAIWAHDEKKFEALLAKIPPLQLYTTCIEELIVQLKHTFGHDISNTQDLYQFIVAEKKGLMTEGLWPEKVPSISEII